MHGNMLFFVLCSAVVTVLALAGEVWLARQRREQRHRSAALHRRLSWYIHGRGL